jgi:hypothetical protein
MLRGQRRPGSAHPAPIGTILSEIAKGLARWHRARSGWVSGSWPLVLLARVCAGAWRLGGVITLGCLGRLAAWQLTTTMNDGIGKGPA